MADSLKSGVLGIDLRFNVYLPDGYQTSTQRDPVVHLLHSASGDGHDWTKKGSAVETLDGPMRCRMCTACASAGVERVKAAPGAVHRHAIACS